MLLILQVTRQTSGWLHGGWFPVALAPKRPDDAGVRRRNAVGVTQAKNVAASKAAIMIRPRNVTRVMGTRSVGDVVVPSDPKNKPATRSGGRIAGSISRAYPARTLSSIWF
jgi:hypothetical protein